MPQVDKIEIQTELQILHESTNALMYLLRDLHQATKLCFGGSELTDRLCGAMHTASQANDASRRIIIALGREA